MNIFIKSIAKKYAVLGALSAQALVLLPSSAFAQAHVTVENGPTMPVPVTGTLNVNPATQVLYPYQQEGSVSDSSTCAPQCMISFPIVPAGRRLVITNASAQLGSNIDIFVIEGNGAAFFVPKGLPHCKLPGSSHYRLLRAWQHPNGEVFCTGRYATHVLDRNFYRLLCSASVAQQKTARTLPTNYVTGLSDQDGAD
jgi:hypothetical protein